MGTPATPPATLTTACYLHPGDPLWLRLWTAVETLTDHGSQTTSRQLLEGLFTDNELFAADLPTISDLAALLDTSATCSPAPDVPHRLGVPAGAWQPDRAGTSENSFTVSDDTRTVRIAVNRAGRRDIRHETRFLEQTSDRRLPEVIGTGPGWVMTRRLPGRPPDRPGPWLRDLRSFLRDIHRLTHHVVPHRRTTSPRRLTAITGRRAGRELDRIVKHGRRRAHLVATHGNLRAENLLVADNVRLRGVADFRHCANAPIERDIACALIALSPVAGVAGVIQLLDREPDRGVLAGELVLRLNLLAGRAANRVPRELYCYLATTIIDNPHAAAELLQRGP